MEALAASLFARLLPELKNCARLYEDKELEPGELTQEELVGWLVDWQIRDSNNCSN